MIYSRNSRAAGDEVNQSRSDGVWRIAKGSKEKERQATGLDSQKGSAVLFRKRSPMGSQSTDLSSIAAKGWTRDSDPAENSVSLSSTILVSILRFKEVSVTK